MNASEIHEAHRRIAGEIVRTPLVEVPAAYLGRDDMRLLLKLECLQRGGAFKTRGATHFLGRLLERGPVTGVITYSSGNHGRAVAEAAARAGVAAVVTVPESIDPSKAAAICAAGAELVAAGNTSESRKQVALELAAKRGLEVVPPFDHDWIIAGQGTVGAEILEEVEDLAGVWAPVGGGGLASGVAAIVHAERPRVPIYTVEPEGAAALARSLESGEREQLAACDSVAEGLLPLAIGARNLAILRAAGVESVTLSEEVILAAFRRLRRELDIACEPSGAVAPAPLLFPHLVPAGRHAPAGTHVAIVSGGNISDERLAQLLES